MRTIAYVYLIEEQSHPGETSGPWTKIGFSKNPPEWRLGANLMRGNPRSLRVATAYEFGSEKEARAAERKAHEAFASARNQKEWFGIHWEEAARWLDAFGATRRQ